MFKRVIALVFALVLTGVLAVGSGSAQDTQTADLTFLLTYIPNIQFSPFYAAIAN